MCRSPTGTIRHVNTVKGRTELGDYVSECIGLALDENCGDPEWRNHVQAAVDAVGAALRSTTDTDLGGAYPPWAV